jgi:hypothetical protein
MALRRKIVTSYRLYKSVLSKRSICIRGPKNGCDLGLFVGDGRWIHPPFCCARHHRLWILSTRRLDLTNPPEWRPTDRANASLILCTSATCFSVVSASGARVKSTNLAGVAVIILTRQRDKFSRGFELGFLRTSQGFVIAREKLPLFFPGRS